MKAHVCFLTPFLPPHFLSVPYLLAEMLKQAVLHWFSRVALPFSCIRTFFTPSASFEMLHCPLGHLFLIPSGAQATLLGVSLVQWDCFFHLPVCCK